MPEKYPNFRFSKQHKPKHIILFRKPENKENEIPECLSYDDYKVTEKTCSLSNEEYQITENKCSLSTDMNDDEYEKYLKSVYNNSEVIEHIQKTNDKELQYSSNLEVLDNQNKILEQSEMSHLDNESDNIKKEYELIKPNDIVESQLILKANDITSKDIINNKEIIYLQNTEIHKIDSNKIIRPNLNLCTTELFSLLQKKFTNLKEKEKKYKNKTRKNKIKNEEIKKLLKFSSDKIQCLTTEISSLQDKIKTLNCKNEIITKEFNEYKSDMKNIVEVFKTNLDSINSDKSSNQLEIKKLNNQTTNLKVQIIQEVFIMKKEVDSISIFFNILCLQSDAIKSSLYLQVQLFINEIQLIKEISINLRNIYINTRIILTNKIKDLNYLKEDIDESIECLTDISNYVNGLINRKKKYKKKSIKYKKLYKKLKINKINQTKLQLETSLSDSDIWDCFK